MWRIIAKTVAVIAILNDKKVKPDCFACGTCMERCPVDAIYFGTRRKAAESRQNPTTLQ